MNLSAPPALQDAYAEWTWEVVWEFAPHTITYCLTRPDQSSRYLKLARTVWYPSLVHEAARMRWARSYLPVPAVLDSGEKNGMEWLLTDALPGIPASAPDPRSVPGGFGRPPRGRPPALARRPGDRVSVRFPAPSGSWPRQAAGAVGRDRGYAGLSPGARASER